MPSTRYELRERSGWAYYAVPELEERGIVHGFFTARSPAHRMEGEERRRFLDAFDLVDLVIMSQEHGDEVHVVKEGERPLSGDGIILLEKGVAGIIKTADCEPVILVEPDFPVAAIVHAGWRGTVQRIAGKAVQMMAGLGAERKKIIALLGPCISRCCYEVQQDVADVFLKEGFSPAVIGRVGDSLRLDLKEANREVLVAESVETIYGSGLCTLCSGLFHSYRGGEKDLRQINFVSLGR